MILGEGKLSWARMAKSCLKWINHIINRKRNSSVCIMDEKRRLMDAFTACFVHLKLLRRSGTKSLPSFTYKWNVLSSDEVINIHRLQHISAIKLPALCRLLFEVRELESFIEARNSLVFRGEWPFENYFEIKFHAIKNQMLLIKVIFIITLCLIAPVYSRRGRADRKTFN